MSKASLEDFVSALTKDMTVKDLNDLCREILEAKSRRKNSMGNRAVITASMAEDVASSNDIGVYLHWNGGRDSVEAFLTYCKMQDFRCPEDDNYGWARLCQVIANFLGGDGLSIGIDRCCNLDCNNCDNSVYVIKGWDIIGRKYFDRAEQQGYDLYDMLCAIDDAQPEKMRLGHSNICEKMSENGN